MYKLSVFFFKIFGFLIVGVAGSVGFKEVGIEGVLEEFGVLEFFDDFGFIETVFFGDVGF